MHDLCLFVLSNNIWDLSFINSLLPGTSVMKVMASDADDPTYGSSARIVYSVLDGEKFFTVDRQTGKTQTFSALQIFLMSGT